MKILLSCVSRFDVGWLTHPVCRFLGAENLHLDSKRPVCVRSSGAHIHFGAHVTSPSIVVKADLKTFTGTVTATV